jgi:putative tryptophan/tyrosine transport system substrate-binding protein
MERRRFAWFVVAALAAPPLVGAQSGKKLWRVAYLGALSPEASNAWFPAFRDGMRDLGYVEGRNLVIDQRLSHGDYRALPALAAELAALKPDLFLTYGAEAAQAADKAGRTIPVVFANIQDPVASGVIASLARPGGNITGLSDAHAASVTKRLELLKEALPATTRVAVLWRPGNDSHSLQLKDLQAAAPTLGLAVLPLPVRNLAEIENAFVKLKAERASAVQLLGDALLTSHHGRIAQLALENRVASMYTLRAFANAGGFIAYGADFRDLFRRAAVYVDKIFKGARPADLPVEQAAKFDLVINLRTARAIGVTVPQGVVLRADHVIQ